MEEFELISASKNGDLESFNQLVRLYQKMAYNLAFRMVGDSHLAEDITQEAFFSAWRHIRGFKGGSFKAWVLKITANACRDELRRVKRRQIIPLESLADDPPATLSELPEDYVLRREMGGIVQEALATLSDDQRMAVTLCDIQGLSYEEVAKAMGCSLGTVKSRISRGRAQLRDYFVKMELVTSESRHEIYNKSI